jgi:hypothetical protein
MFFSVFVILILDFLGNLCETILRREDWGNTPGVGLSASTGGGIRHPSPAIRAGHSTDQGDMKVIVLGGNGATGYHAVRQLLANHVEVTAIVRHPAKLHALQDRRNLEIVTAGILEMDGHRLSELLRSADAVVCCLGHNLTGKGIWGKPRYLVTDAIRRIRESIKKMNAHPSIRLVLMSTTACLNADAGEKRKIGEQIVMFILRSLLPPQRDNEQAAHFLKSAAGVKDTDIEWIMVRPDTLVNEESVTGYSVHPSPIRSPVFNPGKTSRINVGNFIMRLLCEKDLWEKWKYQMPVIYNEGQL